VGSLFKLNFAELGILPGLGASFQLPRLVGTAQAKRLLLCERQILAEQALAAGLIDEVCAADQVLVRALACAAAAAQCAPATVTAIKELLNAGAAGSLREAVERERLQAAVAAR
jgi:enoyl-CoA hydratase/carnithine racemase